MRKCFWDMTTINLLLVHKLQQYQVRVPVATTFAQLKVSLNRNVQPLYIRFRPLNFTDLAVYVQHLVSVLHFCGVGGSLFTDKRTSTVLEASVSQVAKRKHPALQVLMLLSHISCDRFRGREHQDNMMLVQAGIKDGAKLNIAETTSFREHQAQAQASQEQEALTQRQQAQAVQQVQVLQLNSNCLTKIRHHHCCSITLAAFQNLSCCAPLTLHWTCFRKSVNSTQ